MDENVEGKKREPPRVPCPVRAGGSCHNDKAEAMILGGNRRTRYTDKLPGGCAESLTHMSDISQVFEVADICIFWMDISGLNKCIMKKA